MDRPNSLGGTLTAHRAHISLHNVNVDALPGRRTTVCRIICRLHRHQVDLGIAVS
jgi:hypothetical protein